MPIGILGGTFDPVHYGHLRLAEEARQAVALDRVLLIPAGQPPHRAAPQASSGHRLAMVRMAIAGNPALVLDEEEVRSTGPSYTVTTLQRLRRSLGADQPLVLLLGADAFLGLPTWMRWGELFDLAHIAVATRPGYGLSADSLPADLAQHYLARCGPAAQLCGAPAGAVVEFPMTPLEISASRIRKLLGEGRSARYLLPDSVLDYIDRHHLYRQTHGR